MKEKIAIKWLQFTNLFRRRKKAYLRQVPEVLFREDGSVTLKGGSVICVSPGTSFTEWDEEGNWYFAGYSMDELKELRKKRNR